MNTLQIKCPSCRTLMNYTAAACPNCKRRMVAAPTSKAASAEEPPLNADGQPPLTSNKGIIDGLIAGGIILALVLFCCSIGNREPAEQQLQDERVIEMKPVRDEMQRKMNEGKTKEQAAQEIVDEENLRQIIKQQQQNTKSK